MIHHQLVSGGLCRCYTRQWSTLSEDTLIRRRARHLQAAPPPDSMGHHTMVWPEGCIEKVVVLPGLSNSSHCRD